MSTLVGHTGVGMSLMKFDISWYHDSAQVILNQNVDSKNSNPVFYRVLKGKYSDFCVVKSEGVILG